MPADTDFSAAAELALRVPDSEVQQIEEQLSSDIGPIPLAVSVQSPGGDRRRQPAGAASQVQADEELADLAEEQLRVDELRNDLLRELLEDSGAALAGAGAGGGGGGGGGGPPGLGLPGAGLVTRVGGLATGLAGGTTGLAVGGTAAGVAGLGYLAYKGKQAESLEGGRTERLPGTVGSGDTPGPIEIPRPSWLTPDGEIPVEDPENIRVDLVKETLNKDETNEDDDSENPPGPGGSTLPAYLTGGPDSIVKNEQLIEDALAEGGGPPGEGSLSGGSPGGSTAPVSEVGGPDRNTSTGAGLVEAVLGDTGPTPDGSPGGSTPSQTGRRNEAAERRRRDGPNVNVTANVEADGISRREAERIAEEKAEETGEEIREQMRRSGR